jgi:hypothetical protein
LRYDLKKVGAEAFGLARLLDIPKEVKMAAQAPSATRAGWRTLVVSLTLVLGLALPGASPVLADSNVSNTKTVNQTIIEVPGSETGNATSCAPQASADPRVIQKNIQVDASFGDGGEVTQNASNDLTLNQTSAAAGGNASGTNGGIAAAGCPVSTTRATVVQLNLQIVAGRVPEGGVTQNASNIAVLDQTSLAAAGNAQADGTGSSATSGGASATSDLFLIQRNIQIYVGAFRWSSDGTVLQENENMAELGQTTLGISGDASAESGGSSTTGAADATNSTRLSQRNFEFLSDHSGWGLSRFD